MIRIDPIGVWLRFGEKYRALGEPIIDLGGVAEIELARIEFSKVLHISGGEPLLSGRSGDALIDILSDWIFENASYPCRVHVLGWQNLEKRDLICLVSEIGSAFNKVVWGYLEYGDDEEINSQTLKRTIESMKVHFHLQAT